MELGLRSNSEGHGLRSFEYFEDLVDRRSFFFSVSHTLDCVSDLEPILRRRATLDDLQNVFDRLRLQFIFDDTTTRLNEKRKGIPLIKALASKGNSQ